MLAPSPPENPVAVAAAFCAALMTDGGPDLAQLCEIITPGSWNHWGDVGGARDLLTGHAMTTRADQRPDGTADARFVPGPGQTMRADGDVLTAGARIRTLIWRPELGRWQAHSSATAGAQTGRSPGGSLPGDLPPAAALSPQVAARLGWSRRSARLRHARSLPYAAVRRPTRRHPAEGVVEDHVSVDLAGG
jgi:hypothetical protein